MKPRINVITLGVDDLERSVAFYRDGLGWETEGIVGTEFEHAEVAFFELAHGQILALFPRENMSRASGLSGGGPDPVAFSLGYNVNDAASVDAETEKVRAAGATIVQEPHQTAWGGYMSYFQDPDGHLWEIVHVPSLVVEDDPNEG
jgi:catechol 2,3-dioxygenase-like lactoylglutathione lyase family enzyme